MNFPADINRDNLLILYIHNLVLNLTKMKRILILILNVLIIAPTFSQNKLQRAPLNPEYVNYLEAKKKETLKIETPEEYKPGYIPSPLYLHFKERPSHLSLKSANALPTQYDLRTLGYVSPVKNQGGGSFGGNCVAFATMGSIESRLLFLGKGLYDLSEQNIAACYGYEWAYGEGANHEMATAYLTRFSGPHLESEDPYDPTPPNLCLSGLEPVYILPESRWLPKDNNLIKQTIMDFGGLYCSVHIEYDNFNETFKTYYYDGTESGNHAWLVVGWDDIKLVPGATQVGAWIIKNSWGNAWMDTGFVYCSYADTKIMDNVAHWPEVWNSDDIDTVYMYDYLGATSSSGYPGDYTAYGIAKYVAPEEQFITKVGTFVNAEGAVLDIEIYDDFDEKELTNLLNSKSNIYVDLPGYYTFDLPAKVNGDFYIKVRYYTAGWEFPISVETYIQDYSNPVIDTAVNWISPDNKTWNSCDPDTSDEGQNLTIRAYAVKLTSPIAMFESNKGKACLGSDVTYTFLENDSVNEYHWNFGTGASPATADTKGPHQVTYSSVGRKTISLIVAGPNGSDTLVRHDYIAVDSTIKVIIPEREARSPVEQPFVITAFGADTYEWSPAEYLDKTTGQSVTSTPMIPGDYTYIVTGHQGSCSATDTFTLMAKIRPPNDDVCSAFELVFPTVDTFTNRNATVQGNEPAPPEGDCNTPLQWCVEGGLQNSIWFWFTAPSTGIVSFDTKDPNGTLNMDNQIAVYQADTCTDILEDNYTMIAANDDYYPQAQQYACALEAVTVESGKKYFVQFDGSAGGTEGEFILTFSEYGLGIDDPREQISNPLLHIYPNPGTGTFRFNTNTAEYHNMSVQVYNYSGQLIYNMNHGMLYGMDECSLDISAFPAGIYHVRVIFGDEVLHGKIVLE
ncbi:MAG: hypothetical protein AMS27_04640 [Bacteroides sp. SM23_62_1]|nr:MAG: hypothetical protein AMS27_04640 [Bacteroides sp. SM23_62_1]